MPNKKENQNNQLVTKKDLNNALQKQSKVILDEVDIRINNALQKQSKVILDEVDIRINNALQKQSKVILDEVDLRIGKAIQEQSRVILGVLDGISGQLEDLKQESKMNTNLYKRHDKTLENHEKRIKNLETVK